MIGSGSVGRGSVGSWMIGVDVGGLVGGGFVGRGSVGGAPVAAGWVVPAGRGVADAVGRPVAGGVAVADSAGFVGAGWVGPREGEPSVAATIVAIASGESPPPDPATVVDNAAIVSWSAVSCAAAEPPAAPCWKAPRTAIAANRRTNPPASTPERRRLRRERRVDGLSARTEVAGSLIVGALWRDGSSAWATACWN